MAEMDIGFKLAAHSIVAAVGDTKERGDLLTALGIFGKMRYPAMNAFDLIGREQMRDSPFYQEILAEGRIEAQRKAILEVLDARLGSAATTEFRDVLDTITDPARLTELLRAASKCRGVGGFRRALRLSQT